MCKKLICLSSFILLLGLVAPCIGVNTDPGLMGWWTLDGHAIDVSGNDRHGTLNGTPQFAPGMYGQALEFDGDDYVSIDGYKGVLGTNPWSATAWIKMTNVDDHRCVINWGTPANGQRIELRIMSGSGILRANHGAGNVNTNTAVNDGQWHHIAVTSKENAFCQYPDMILYIDGQDDTVPSEDTDPLLDIVAGADLGIGIRASHNDRFWDGSIDEVRMYDRVLIPEEIQQIMEVAGQPYPFATSPDPADGALVNNTWTSLSWSPGAVAVSHDVYLGENLEDVESGAEGTFQANQAGTEFTVGFPGFPVPDGLVPGTTYYWRIDEVNQAEPNSPFKGKVWSFSVPPRTAYFPDPADGAEAVSVNAKLSWAAGFDAKLHYAYFGDNFDDVSNAAGSLPLGDAAYDPGPLKMAETYYWRIDEFDIIETHKGEVWSFTTEGAVAAIDPANGAVDVTQTPVLTWAPGQGATHEVYFGADEASLELKGSGNLGEESYEPGQLEWNTTYYWRVDEANNANPDSPWTGPLWNFTTANFHIVDDMESYNDLNEDEPDSNRIYLAWIDGFDNPAINGSVVGNVNAPFAEQTIVHSGNQSMPMSYDNAVGKSEATLTLTANRDWTVNGVNTLTIWFRGALGNTAETLYVALNGNARIDHDDPDATLKTYWSQWNIDLQAFADQGVNFASVNSITLGLSSGTSGTGMMYFDDIRLYPLAP
ncbi:MAG: LamG domain-containing protein [Planctomycetes bacterium]|nr:LamG domain-containing protein [Planctomycetota bacterium]